VDYSPVSVSMIEKELENA